MYAGWPCPTPAGAAAEEMVLGFDQNRPKRLLIISPLFDEANKFRHQLVQTMRKLDAQGLDSFLPDLPGCNESTASFAEQDLAHWRDAVMAAATHFAATHVLAIRSGCWLVPATLPGWLYAPAKPKQVLRGMLRTRILSAREAGKTETTEELAELGRRDGITLAGWDLSAELVRQLETEALDLPDGYRIIEQADLGGSPPWLRAENDYDPAQADALAGAIVSGMGEA